MELKGGEIYLSGGEISNSETEGITEDSSSFECKDFEK